MAAHKDRSTAAKTSALNGFSIEQRRVNPGRERALKTILMKTRQHCFFVGFHQSPLREPQPHCRPEKRRRLRGRYHVARGTANAWQPASLTNGLSDPRRPSRLLRFRERMTQIVLPPRVFTNSLLIGSTGAQPQGTLGPLNAPRIQVISTHRRWARRED